MQRNRTALRRMVIRFKDQFDEREKMSQQKMFIGIRCKCEPPADGAPTRTETEK